MTRAFLFVSDNLAPVCFLQVADLAWPIRQVGFDSNAPIVLSSVPLHFYSHMLIRLRCIYRSLFKQSFHVV